MGKLDPDDDRPDDELAAAQVDEAAATGLSGPADEEHAEVGGAHDGDDRGEWERLNHRVALLVERCWFSNDPDAAEELSEIFDRWIFPLARSASYAFLGDRYRPYVEELLSVAFVVARTAIDKGIDMPLAYVVRSLRNHHRRKMRVARKRFKNEVLVEHLERPSEHSDAFHLVHERETDKIIREAFHDWRQDYVAKKDRYGEMIVDVLELCYLTGESQSESYQTLQLTATERRRVAERLARMRGNERSKLHRLAAIASDSDDGWWDGPSGRGGKEQ